MKNLRAQTGYSTIVIVIGGFIVVAGIITAILAFSSHPSGTTTDTKAADSLSINAWHIKFPLTSGITDAQYSMAAGGVATLTTAKLEKLIGKIQGCTSGLHSVHIQRSAIKPNYKPTWGPVQADKYYYYAASAVEPACVSEVSGSDAKSIQSINAELLTAAQNLTTK